MTHYKKLFEIHSRNLTVLVEQVSRLGFEYAPPHMINRLEDELERINELCRQQGFLLPDCVHTAYDILRRANPISPSQDKPMVRKSELRDEPKFDAFLSYASGDAEKVLTLAERLKAEEIMVWFDQEQIQPGDSILRRIEEGLRRSVYVLACLSRSFLESKWCGAEYESILNREISKGEVRIIPVVLSDFDVDSLPPLLYDKLRVDLRTKDGFHLLVRMIKGRGAQR